MQWDADFIAFVRTRNSELHRAAWLLVGEPAGAADLVQETFAGLYPKWDRVQAAAEPIAYVRRAMLNRYLSARRKMGNWRVATEREQQGDAPEPVSGADQFESRMVLMAPMASLPDKQRAAIVLRYYLDLDDRSAAAAMNSGIATYRSHLRRAHRALQDALQRQSDLPDHLFMLGDRHER